jgi:hypothetical protein
MDSLDHIANVSRMLTPEMPSSATAVSILNPACVSMLAGLLDGADTRVRNDHSRRDALALQ